MTIHYSFIGGVLVLAACNRLAKLESKSKYPRIQLDTPSWFAAFWPIWLGAILQHYFGSSAVGWSFALWLSAGLIGAMVQAINLAPERRLADFGNAVGRRFGWFSLLALCGAFLQRLDSNLFGYPELLAEIATVVSAAIASAASVVLVAIVADLPNQRTARLQ